MTTVDVDNKLVEQKDVLLSWIYSAHREDELDLVKMTQVLDTLYFVVRLWGELSYAYKAAELAKECRLALENAQDQSTLGKALYMRAVRLEERAYQLHQRYMYG